MTLQCISGATALRYSVWSRISGQHAIKHPYLASTRRRDEGEQGHRHIPCHRRLGLPLPLGCKGTRTTHSRNHETETRITRLTLVLTAGLENDNSPADLPDIRVKHGVPEHVIPALLREAGCDARVVPPALEIKA